eukprot:15347284-Ditylum_brightwellii.AAC.1
MPSSSTCSSWASSTSSAQASSARVTQTPSSPPSASAMPPYTAAPPVGPDPPSLCMPSPQQTIVCSILRTKRMPSRANPLDTAPLTTRWRARFALYIAASHTFEPTMPTATLHSLPTPKMGNGASSPPLH